MKIEGSLVPDIRRPMRGLSIAASGLSAQRTRIEVIAENIANAETTRGVDGTPYRRKSVQLRALGAEPIMLQRSPSEPGGLPDTRAGVEVAGIIEDASEGQFVYDPGHPDADDSGYVVMPNVSLTDEMVELMDARRLFEANATTFEAIKAMLRRATQI